MILLANNRLRAGTITADNNNLNYPVTNIIHRYFTKVYRSNSTTDTITIEFNESETVNCIAIGYQNLDSITAKLYDVTSTLLSTKTLTPSDIMTCFTAITDVKTITLEISTTATYCEIGSIFIGQSVTTPNIDLAYKKIIGDKTEYTKTDGGQVNGRKKAKLKGYQFTIPYATIEQLEAFEDIIEDLQKVDPFWLDLYSESHSTIPPLFCNIISIQDAIKLKGYGYGYGFSVEECR